MFRWSMIFFVTLAAVAQLVQGAETNLIFNTTVTYSWPPGRAFKFSDGNKSHNYLYFQNDGNAVLYDHQGQKVLWASNTAGYTCNSTTSTSPSNCNLNWQGDGNFVIYVNGKPIWATSTSPQGTYLVFSYLAPYVAIYDKSGNHLYPYIKTADAPHPPKEPGPGDEPGPHSGEPGGPAGAIGACQGGIPCVACGLSNACGTGTHVS